MIKAVIFDCFGVLIGDGLELMCQGLEKTDPQGRAYISDLIHQTNRGLMETDEFIRQLSERLGMNTSECRTLISKGEVRNEEVIELVHSLRGQYKTALLSNIGRGSLAKRFNEDELAGLFDVVVPSAEVGMMKPDPEIYEYTAEKLGVEPGECVFIDDRETQVEGARRVGMQCIVFKNATQLKSELSTLMGRPA